MRLPKIPAARELATLHQKPEDEPAIARGHCNPGFPWLPTVWEGGGLGDGERRLPWGPEGEGRWGSTAALRGSTPKGKAAVRSGVREVGSRARRRFGFMEMDNLGHRLIEEQAPSVAFPIIADPRTKLDQAACPGHSPVAAWMEDQRRLVQRSAVGGNRSAESLVFRIQATSG